MENLELHKKIAEEQRSRMPYGNYTVPELLDQKNKNQERINTLRDQSDTLTEIEYKSRFEAGAEDAGLIKEVEIVNLQLDIEEIDKELKRRELLN